MVGNNHIMFLYACFEKKDVLWHCPSVWHKQFLCVSQVTVQVTVKNILMKLHSNVYEVKMAVCTKMVALPF